MTEESSASKYLLRIFICIVILWVSISVPVLGQEKQKIPSNFFAGRWVGEISAECKWFDLKRKSELAADGRSTIKIFNLLISEYDEEEEKKEFTPDIPENLQKLAAQIRNSFEGRAEFSAINRFYDTQGKIGETLTLVNNMEIINIDGHFLKDNRIYFSSENKVKVKTESFLGTFFDESPAFSVGAFCSMAGLDGVKFEVNEGNIFINNEVSHNNEDSHTRFIGKIIGQLYRIETLKKAFPKDIKPNEPIKTDKKTQIEVTLPDIGTIEVSENTEAEFKSESLLEVIKGKICTMIEKIRGKNKFEIHTPTCIVAVRGTKYAIDVEDNGTTTLIVLNGEVELSDKEMKKTIIVRENQLSVVKLEGLPSDPVSIEPDQILRWWE